MDDYVAYCKVKSSSQKLADPLKVAVVSNFKSSYRGTLLYIATDVRTDILLPSVFIFHVSARIQI